MAFEAYLQQDVRRPSRGRRLTYILSAVAHGLGVLAAVAYSFWHVEEVTPSTVTVTFVSAAAAPPPPPPPPPLGGGGPSLPKHRPTVRPKAENLPKPTEVVQPKLQPDIDPIVSPPKDERPAEAAAASRDVRNGTAEGPGTPEGVKGGVSGGLKGGIVNGTGVAPSSSAKFLPPQIGAQQKLSGADPEFPTSLRRAGASYLVMAKICVASGGAVESVTLLKRAQPTLDGNVVAAVKAWRFRPLMVNGTPAPFCYFGRFEFKSE